ncbi:MAG: NFYB/HAP3 family transcription factor subunit [Nanoarchaeota archaeon]|nr:NFYB/HAP3 family transcription factor subunit [Nanoarchaeota archaeon]MBU1703891.1 NFYB/HAP3 family transcription factor subunit [Nanoarchaeota archaeon]
MGQKRTLFPLAVMEKVFKKIKNDIRVSETAKVELEKVINEYATRIGETSIKAAEHAGRKTVKAEDIELSVKNLTKSF